MSVFVSRDTLNLQKKKVRPSEFYFQESRDLNGVRMFLKELTSFYETDVRFRSENTVVHFNYFRLFRENLLEDEANHSLKVLCELIRPSVQERRKV